ncbi:ArsR family transcriptional regulator [Halobiforma lacisalsi AJ5]|uniref:ArsR family transcriptional regulator n=1 Tax=Natronobacterium lacisalsi AJ5 TaxID=358396 RepID=M0L6J6_NATLA|nr:winged helix-turn-helix transcriptional regulator [Halobiforma lacisalsi]APW97898.1 ArsR family transcriptional regulator [Halobiforma lacisalsi AJ5]EMA29166.1 AsnC family transcriptional regulator [Halobiforma lacisalsi AJ5]
MRDLDETDIEILELLSENARRPYKEIADHVGLTPPAVSDRISRLEEQGIIEGFTIDVDREKLRGETAALIELEPAPAAVADVYAAAADLEGVEGIYEGMDGRVLVHATLPSEGVRSWLETELDLSELGGYDVTLLSRSDRLVGVSAAGFALECVVCGKEVTGDGVTATVGGEVKTFCCPSCEDRYVSRYESHQDALE